MLGAIIGDIVGSTYEFGSCKSKTFTLFRPGCRPTDDSIMTIAVGRACADADITDEDDFKDKVISHMRRLGRMYRAAGYGGMFYRWLMSDYMGPYGSFGNGSAMRVSPVAYAGRSLEEVEQLAQWSAEVTHDHPNGIAGAQAVAGATYLARMKESKDAIKEYVEKNFYDLSSFTLDEIRPSYKFDVTCQGSVPQAIRCFLEAESYEDAIRLAVSLGGDADTQAAMAGAIAEAYYGIPEEISEQGLSYLDETLLEEYEAYAEWLY